MYVQLTIELITKAIQLFCQKEIKEKDARKICESLAEDDDVEKHHFCEATCVKSKRTCMKKVEDHGMHCYVHDPDRKCHGITLKGDRCRSVAKVGEMYCTKHHDQGGRSGKGKKQAIVEQDESTSEDELAPRKKSPKKPSKKETKKSKSTHTSEDVVDSEEESPSDEESVPPKKHKETHSKKKNMNKTKQVVTSEDESSASEEEPPKKKQSKKITKKHEKNTKESKKSKEVVSSEDEPSEEEKPVKEPAKTTTENSKKNTKSTKTDETVANIFWERFPHVYDKSGNSVVLSKKELPKKTDILWTQCSFDKSHGYCTNYVLDGCHLLKKWRTDEIVGQLLKMPAKDDHAYLRGRPFAVISKKALVDMGFTVNELPKDYKPPLGAEYVVEKKPHDRKTHSKKSKDIVSSGEESVDESVEESGEESGQEDESASEEEKTEEHIWTKMDPVNLTALKNVPIGLCFNWQIHPYNRKLEYSTSYTINGKYIVKMVGTNAYVDLCTLDNLQGNGGEEPLITAQDRKILDKLELHPLSPSERKILELSMDKDDDESSSEEEEEEQTYPLNRNVHNITSMENLPVAEDGGWTIYPLDKRLEYATNFTIRDKYVIRLAGKNVYVELCPKESMGGKGDAPELDTLERSILSKMKLKEMSTTERKKIFQEESEDDSNIPAKQTVDKSKVKWKKFDNDLEYSTNLFVSGKCILKKRHEDVVVGLVTDKHISSEDVVFDRMTLKEKEEIFNMGFVPDAEYMREESESDEEHDA
jgi:hypothetical protein